MRRRRVAITGQGIISPLGNDPVDFFAALMAGCGAVEFVACVQALVEQAVTPTRHLAVATPDCDLDYVPNQGCRIADLEYAMSNSFAFGGTSAVLTARRH